MASARERREIGKRIRAERKSANTAIKESEFGRRVPNDGKLLTDIIDNFEKFCKHLSSSGSQKSIDDFLLPLLDILNNFKIENGFIEFDEDKLDNLKKRFNAEPQRVQFAGSQLMTALHMARRKVQYA